MLLEEDNKMNFKKGYDNMENVIYLEDALRGYVEVAKKLDLNGAIVITKLF